MQFLCFIEYSVPRYADDDVVDDDDDDNDDDEDDSVGANASGGSDSNTLRRISSKKRLAVDDDNDENAMVGDEEIESTIKLSMLVRACSDRVKFLRCFVFTTRQR